MGYQLRTENNRDLFECSSALQKSIRRGREYEALHFAFEIESAFPDYLWRRLTIIANEDIGLASPMTIVLIETLCHQYKEIQAKASGPAEKMILCNAIGALCRAAKTRYADDFFNVVYRRWLFEKERLEIPDYAIDRHTAKGKRMGRGAEHFAEVGQHLENEAEGLNAYKDEANRLREKYGKLEKRRPNGKGKIKTEPTADEAMKGLFK